MFAAHGAVVALLLFGLALSRHGHAGDGVLQRHDGLDRTRKGQLYRAAHLAAVGSCGHDGTERAHVKEVLAHPLAGLAYVVGAAFAFVFGRLFLFCIDCYVFCSFLCLFLGRCVQIQCGIGALVLVVEDGLFAHVDFKALFAIRWRTLVLLFHQPHKIAHLALEGHIGHQPVAGLSIQARHVACIGVSVGVTVFDIKDQNEVVSVSEAFVGAHAVIPSRDAVWVLALVVESSVFLVKKSCRWW